MILTITLGHRSHTRSMVRVKAQAFNVRRFRTHIISFVQNNPQIHKMIKMDQDGSNHPEII